MNELKAERVFESYERLTNMLVFVQHADNNKKRDGW